MTFRQKRNAIGEEVELAMEANHNDGDEKTKNKNT